MPLNAFAPKASCAITIPARRSTEIVTRMSLGYFLLALRFAFFAGFFFAAFFFAAMCAPFALRRLSIVPPGAVAASDAAGSFVIQRRADALTVRGLRARFLARIAYPRSSRMASRTSRRAPRRSTVANW